MKRFLFTLCFAALLYFAADSATNAVARAESAVAVQPAGDGAAKGDGRCEATTKSGNRCKRKAVPGERLCRQHLKAAAK